MTSKKEYVILSASEISHDHSDKAYTLRKFTLPGVDSPDETGEVARVSATKGGRAVEPASLRSQRQLIFRVIASASVAIPLKEYAVYTPYFVPTDCRGRYAPSQ